MSQARAVRRRGTAHQVVQDGPTLPVGASRRLVAHWLLAAAAAAVVIAGVGTTAALINGSSTSPAGPAAASFSPGTQQFAAGPWSSSGQDGTSRPWRLFVHCGAPVIVFDGRAWAPVVPVPPYPGPGPVNGITTDTGYSDGTLTVLSADRLRFTASGTMAPYTLSYTPASPSTNTTAPVCA